MPCTDNAGNLLIIIINWHIRASVAIRVVSGILLVKCYISMCRYLVYNLFEILFCVEACVTQAVGSISSRGKEVFNIFLSYTEIMRGI